MVDLLFVLLLVALFAVTTGFVRVCDRMLGSDDVAIGSAAPTIAEEPDRAAK